MKPEIAANEIRARWVVVPTAAFGKAHELKVGSYSARIFEPDDEDDADPHVESFSGPFLAASENDFDGCLDLDEYKATVENLIANSLLRARAVGRYLEEIDGV